MREILAPEGRETQSTRSIKILRRDRFFTFGAVLVLFARSGGISSFINMERHETRAADALRAINTAQIQYARTHPAEGFASSLEDLGPSPGAGLIDQDLADGGRYNYIIALAPASADKSGRMDRYTLTARPDPFGSCARRSFSAKNPASVRSRSTVAFLTYSRFGACRRLTARRKESIRPTHVETQKIAS